MSRPALNLTPEAGAGDPPAGVAGLSVQDMAAYPRDFLQRSILFWDALRQRANITPPHQALGWVPAVYRDTEDRRRDLPLEREHNER